MKRKIGVRLKRSFRLTFRLGRCCDLFLFRFPFIGINGEDVVRHGEPKVDKVSAGEPAEGGPGVRGGLSDCGHRSTERRHVR